ncbi:MAG: hypothetical protein EZS28_006370 [Streblomastix strix]|uniref:Uncharacterized protein n=1 Tax=Streblomastix strix TaxID=222440 RepID=A0A5J4WT34_9EUKA|nr:MAG: hypothetical protein EZS28_006370 [Streblomastix strix]
MKSPTTPEVEPQFEKEIDPFQQPFQQSFQQQVIRCETPTLSARRTSSVFEETLTPDPSVYRQLLDIISEDEHLVKESAHFVLSENQLIRVVAYTFDVHESQIQWSIEDEGCCGRFCNDLTQTHIMVQVTPEPYIREEIDEIFDKKLYLLDQIDTYTKQEDDALLLMKADKSELIDTYSKTEDDELRALKLNILDQIDAYTKQEDDVLLLLKADKSELIEAYSKTESDAILDEKLNISDQIDAYTKSEYDALLLLLKTDKIKLADYVNLGIAQTISSQKQFNIITVASVSKQSKNDASILLAGGGDMLVSSLVNQTELQKVQDIASEKSKAYIFDTCSDLNDWMVIQDNVAKLAIGDNLYIVDKQVLDYWWYGIDLKVLETEQPDMTYVITTFGTTTGGALFNLLAFMYKIITIQALYQLVVADQIDAYTKGEDDDLLLLKADKTQLTIAYSKIETNNLLNNKAYSGVSYTKGEDNPLLLLKTDKTQLNDAYTNGEADNLLNYKADSGVSYTKGEDDALLLLKTDKTQLIDAYTKGETNNLLKNKTAGASGASVSVCTLENAGLPKHLFYADDIVFAGSSPHVANFRFGTDGKFTITIQTLIGTADAAGLSYFLELYAYIKERYPKLLGQQPQPVPIGDQSLQQQVKNDDDIIYGSGDGSNEEFKPPMLNAITKLDLNSQLERQSFLASSGSDPQLIVFGDRITLTASYATTCLFPGNSKSDGYLFKSYPFEARPKLDDQIIELVETDVPNTYNKFCYIDQNETYNVSSRWLPSNTALVLNITYYNQYELLKKINYDVNNDGKIDIMESWNVNGKGQFEAQSYVYETVKKQTNLIDAGVYGLNGTNYLNSEIKLTDELAIYKADRAAYFIKDGPFITYSFETKLAQLGTNSNVQQTIYKLFSTISKKILPHYTKYMPIHVEQQEFSAMCLFKDMYDKSSAVQVAVSGQLNMLDCEFQGTYILDNYTNALASNEASNEAASDSFIDEVIIKHEKQLSS